MYAQGLAWAARAAWQGLKRVAASPAGQQIAVTASGYVAAKASNNMVRFLRTQGVPINDSVAQAVPQVAAMLGSRYGSKFAAGDVAAASVEAVTGHRAPNNADLRQYRVLLEAARAGGHPVPTRAVTPPPIAPPPPMPSFLDMSRLRPQNAYQGPNPMIKPPEPRPPIPYGTN